MRITKDHLYEIFSVYGKIKEIDLHIDRFNKSNKRFSFIVYSTPKEAENAMLFMNRGKYYIFILTITSYNKYNWSL